MNPYDERDFPIVGRDGPDVPERRPYQPKPISVRCERVRLADGRAITFIVRSWSPRDRGRCKLCPAHLCDNRGDVCLVRVEGNVPDAGLMMYAIGPPPATFRRGGAALEP